MSFDFNFTFTDADTPAGAGLVLETGFHKFKIASVADTERSVKIGFTPTEGSGVAYRSFGKNSKSAPFWLALFMGAFGKTEEALKAKPIKFGSAEKLAQVLVGKPAFGFFQKDGHEYNGKKMYDLSIITPKSWEEGKATYVAKAAASNSASLGQEEEDDDDLQDFLS